MVFISIFLVLEHIAECRMDLAGNWIHGWLICFVHIRGWVGILSGPLLLGMIFRV